MTTTGIWLGASYVLGQPVPVTEPYPHICHVELVARITGQRFKMRRLDCAACVAQFSPKAEPSTDLPAVPAEVLELEARRYGEHEGDE